MTKEKLLMAYIAIVLTTVAVGVVFDARTVTWCLAFVVAVIVYFLPASVARMRHHRNRGAIAVLNVLLGWTFLGWVIALVWACIADTVPSRMVEVSPRPVRPDMVRRVS